MSQPPSPARRSGGRPPEVELRRLAGAYQISRAVQVAAQMELGGLLSDGPRTVAELARDTGTRAGALRRLLRFLADLCVVEELPGDAFGPTPLSERLDALDDLVSGDEAWSAWSALPEVLRTGRSAFPDLYGRPFFEYAAAHPEQACRWREGGSASARRLAPAVAEALALAGTETVVDVGGGDAAVLAEVLRRHPGCRGVLLELPEAVAAAGDRLSTAGVARRCRVIGANAFEGVPGGDVVLLCRVLFNWNDERARALLRRCREALGARGRLVVVEPLMPAPDEPRAPGFAAADLHHLLLWDGGYRTGEEMATLVGSAGFAVAGPPEPLGRGAGAASGWSRLEARPV